MSGGSIQNMRNTLKNNSDILRKRIRLFERKTEFQRLKESYRKASGQLADYKTATAEEREFIRQKVLTERKRDFRNRLLLIGILAASATSLLVITSINPTSTNRNVQSPYIEKSMRANIPSYQKSLMEGEEMMEKGQWFFAAGHFENALSVAPTDSVASYKLALAYCELCLNGGSACEKANELVRELIEESSQPEKYKRLKSLYLEPSSPNKNEKPKK